MKAKRKYKDSVFRHMFKDKIRLCHLYQALSGDNKVSADDIIENTLHGVFFNDIKNDLSFRVGHCNIILLEHQSSWNPNMPLRMFWYLSKLYRQQIDPDMPYKSTLVKIAAPKFYVFYNGETPAPYFQQFRLSDAFAGASSSLELIVDCYNINYTPNNQLLNDCYELRCYSIFIQRIRDGLQQKLSLEESIKQAITYCKTHDLMADYFSANEREVFDMVSFKWDDKRALEVAKEEALEEGIAKGEARGEHRALTKVVLSLLKKKMSLDFIMDSTDLSAEEIRKIAKDNGLAF